MTITVERESTVARVVVARTARGPQPAVGDSLSHKLLVGTGVAIFYGVLFGLSAWNIYQLLRQAFE